MLLYVLPYLCAFAALKLPLQPFSLYVCAHVYLIYKEKNKTALFAVCSRFPS